MASNSLFRNIALKSGLFEEDDPKAAPPTGLASHATAAPPDAPLPAASPSTTVDNATAQALAAQVLSGVTAYMGFLKQMQALETVVPDPSQRVKAAIATSGAAGVTVVAISASIDQHMARLEAEKHEFEGNAQTEAKHALDAKRRDCEQLATAIEAKRHQLAALQAEITKDEQAVLSKKEEIEAQTQQITNVAAAFTRAYDALLQRLQDEKQRVLS